jgi:hypothetical protein
MLAASEAARRVEASDLTADAGIETATSFVQWGAVIAGALVAAAVSLILITFGASIGMSIVSSTPTWRDSSSALAVASGIYLLLTALVSFGVGGYVAGRLRERWNLSAPSEVIEFRDGTHGVVAWAIAVVVTGLVLAATAASLASKAVGPTTSPASTTGEPIFAYDVDRLFRADRHPTNADLTYTRAEAGRILLAASGRQGISSDDRAYLVRLVEANTGVAAPEAERRVDSVITAATDAVHKARRSAVVLGFSTAASLLLGAAVAWYAACAGGRHRDHVAPPLTWRWPHGFKAV